jgi:hypothetical protein
MTDADEPLIAFAVGPHELPALEIRVNFGVYAARQATPAEIERLAERLLGELESVTVVAEERYEIGAGAEASVRQVRISLAPDRVPADPLERRALEARLVEHAEEWARSCIEDRAPGP